MPNSTIFANITIDPSMTQRTAPNFVSAGKCRDAEESELAKFRGLLSPFRFDAMEIINIKTDATNGTHLFILAWDVSCATSPKNKIGKQTEYHKTLYGRPLRNIISFHSGSMAYSKAVLELIGSSYLTLAVQVRAIRLPRLP
jgi:hypothetical protein